MGLQVRLRHALGERLFDLPDRPAENPLIVGRAREADLKIPSVTVASQHCALFLHENQWVLQDTSGGSTWVNGNAIEGPTPLCVGDVITLGSDASPATVEIDPAGVAQGLTGYAAETHDRAPAAPAGPATSSAAPRQAGGYYGAAPSRSAPPPPPPQQAASEDPWGTGGDDAMAGWGQPAASAGANESAPVRRKKAPKKMSEGAMIAGIGACLLIVGGTIWFAYKEMHPEPPPAPPAAAPVDNSKHHNNIFDIGSADPAPSSSEKRGTAQQSFASATPAPRAIVTPRPQPRTTDTPDDAQPPPQSPAPTPAAVSEAPGPPAADADSRKGDKAWDEVEGANISPEIGQAILKFDDYRRQHPGANTKELDAYTDEAMDRLWWKRITMLCKKRDDINVVIRGKDKDIRDEPSAAFKKTLGDEKQKKEAELALVLEHLSSDMGYASDDAPDLDNADAMQKLLAARDASKFGAWKLHTLKHIRNNHGATPWDGE